MSGRALRVCLALAYAVLGTVGARADGCPTVKDEIVTDRPDVTNSSLVVPVGSLQSENGVNFSTRDGGQIIDGTNTRWRLGIASCLELLVDLPTYSHDHPRFGKFWVFRRISSDKVAGQSDTGKSRLVRGIWRGAADRCGRHSWSRHTALSANAMVVGTERRVGRERNVD